MQFRYLDEGGDASCGSCHYNSQYQRVNVTTRNVGGGAEIVGSLNLGGSVDMIPNAIRIAELSIDKQAQTLLMPVSARRQLNDLPDEQAGNDIYLSICEAQFRKMDIGAVLASSSFVATKNLVPSALTS